MFAVTTRRVVNSLKTIITSSQPINTTQYRNFFPYLRIAFNQVDTERLKDVGPDRLCAEW